MDLNIAKGTRPYHSFSLESFIKDIAIDDDTKTILDLIIKYEVVEIRYEALKDFRGVYKCKVTYYPGNIETCCFSFLYKKLNHEQ